MTALPHLYLHTLTHGYLSDLSFCTSALDLRHSLDLATLDSVFENQIDYGFIEHRLSSYEYIGFSEFHNSLGQILFVADKGLYNNNRLNAKHYF